MSAFLTLERDGTFWLWVLDLTALGESVVDADVQATLEQPLGEELGGPTWPLQLDLISGETLLAHLATRYSVSEDGAHYGARVEGLTWPAEGTTVFVRVVVTAGPDQRTTISRAKVLTPTAITC